MIVQPGIEVTKWYEKVQVPKKAPLSFSRLVYMKQGMNEFIRCYNYGTGGTLLNRSGLLEEVR